MNRMHLIAVTGVVLLGPVAPLAGAQTGFPERPIDIVTHASPGGGTDATARAVARGMRAALDADLSVLPRTGGGGVVAMSFVNGRPRDGHTLLAITPTHLFAMARGQGPLTIDDVVGVARAADDPIVVMVRNDSDIASLAGTRRTGPATARQVGNHADRRRRSHRRRNPRLADRRAIERGSVRGGRGDRHQPDGRQHRRGGG